MFSGRSIGFSSGGTVNIPGGTGTANVFIFCVNADGSGVPVGFDAYIAAGTALTFAGLSMATRINFIMQNGIGGQGFMPGGALPNPQFSFAGDTITFINGNKMTAGDWIAVIWQ